MKILKRAVKSDTKYYHILNACFSALILAIFLYSALYSVEKNDHPIPSFYEKLSGEKSPTSGLSRAFSEIIRLRFKSAREYNEYSIPLFLFFLIQLAGRIAVSALLLWSKYKSEKIALADGIISALLFLCCYSGLIKVFLQAAGLTGP